MSLRIDIDYVKSVLLADGWHPVYKESFDIDSYEFIQEANSRPMLIHSGEHSTCAAGFSFMEDEDTVISGPMTAILAVRR
jgi:hypothetical protein